VTTLLFTHTAWLAGLGALAVPILIHLLLKRKRLKIKFSTLRFFDGAEQNAQQRRKLRQWLLLAMRLLAMALLVLAFARPYRQEQSSTSASEKRRQVVVVVDRSASLQARDTRGRRWDRVLAEAQKRLRTLALGDRVALVTVGPGAQVLAPETGAANGQAASAFVSATEMAKQLEKLGPTLAAGELGDGLSRADQLLAPSSANVTNEIWVISDLQRNSCASIAARPVRRDALLVPVGVAENEDANVAITALRCGIGLAGSPQVALTSFADRDSSAARLKVALDEQVLVEQTLQIPAGAVTNLSFSLPALAPGWHDLHANLDLNDSLGLDNDRWAAFHSAAPIRVLVVETRANVKAFEEETLFIACALDPGGTIPRATQSRTDVWGALGQAFRSGNTNSGGSTGFLVQKELPDQAASRLRPGGEQPSVVMLPGLARLPSGLGPALVHFVEQGGGLLLFVNESLSASDYNRELGALLPARLRMPDRAADPGWRLEEFDFESPVFAVFRTPGNGTLALPEFTRRFLFLQEPTNGVLARFHDGSPAVLCRSVGRGRVLLVNTSADTAWTDWPKHRVFVPWVQGVANFLAGRSSQISEVESVSAVAGEDTDLQVEKPDAGRALVLRQAGSPDLKLTADSTGTVLIPGATKTGVWSLQDNTGRELRRVAVNVPGSESDLAVMTAAEFAQAVPRRDPSASSAELSRGSTAGRKEYDGLLFAVLLVLLVAELSLANRTLT
jgi:hypothetical protein